MKLPGDKIGCDLMQRKVKIMIALVISILLMMLHIIPFIDGQEQRLPRSENGVLDLSQWDFEASGNVQLNGEWRFIPNRLVDFEEWMSYEAEATTLQVPGVWNAVINPAHPESFGEGTYQLRIILPASHENSLTSYGYHTANIRTTHRVYIQEVNHAGMTQQLDFMMDSRRNVPYTTSFAVHGSAIDILMQVTNYEHGSAGGIVRPISFGHAAAIYKQDKLAGLMDIALTTITALHALIAGSLYFAQRDQKHLLYFALLHAFASIYVMTTGERLLFQAIPEISQEVGYKLMQASTYAYLYCCYMFLSRLYLEFSRPFIDRTVQAGTILAILLAVFMDDALFSTHDIFRMITISLLSLYLLYFIVRALFAHREDAAYLLLTGTAMLSIGLPDILLNIKIEYRQPPPIDQAVFLLSIMLLAVQRFVQTTRQVTQLRLQRAHMETALLQAQIKPHFLFNSLNTIGSLVESDPPRAQDLIADFSNYLRFSFDLSDLEPLVPFKREWLLVETYLQLEQARYEELLQVHADISAAEGVMLPPLTLQPLVENAIRHGLMRRENGGTITILATRDGSDVILSISDDGVGIPATLLARLGAEPLESIDRNEMSGAGIGLYNINHRLESSFGQGLTVVSREGEGTTVTFRVPHT
jgi:two-component system LytT family sensor kinase